MVAISEIVVYNMSVVVYERIACKKYTHAASMPNPINFLMCIIHMPARGNMDIDPENVPMTISSAPIPSEKLNSVKNPTIGFPCLATIVSRTDKTGVIHGEAIDPVIMPNKSRKQIWNISTFETLFLKSPDDCILCILFKMELYKFQKSSSVQYHF